MTRLGLWGFRDAAEMVALLSKSKIGALELCALSLKVRGERSAACRGKADGGRRSAAGRLGG